MAKDDLDWAREYVERGAWLLHLETRVAGRAVELYDGDGVRWVSRDQRPVLDPVLKLHQGHTFVAKRGAFMELTEADGQFAGEFQSGLAALVAFAGRRGGELSLTPAVGAMVIAALMRAQLLEVERLFQRTAASSAGHEDQPIASGPEEDVCSEG
jgi:hypothetical protein